MTINTVPATEAQLLRTAAPRFERLYDGIYVGAPLDYVTQSLFQQGVPVSLPPTTKTTAVVRSGVTTIDVVDTTGYPTSGATNIAWTNPSINTFYVARYIYTGKTSTSFTGVAFLSGYPGYMGIGAAVTPWLNVTDRIVESSIEGASVWKDVAFDWSYSLAGHFFNSTMFPRDGSFLITHSVTPNGRFGTWAYGLTSALGFARQYSAEGDVDAQRRWSTQIAGISTYFKTHRVTARRYGEEDLAAEASVTTSPNLANPLAESEEFRGGRGTTTGANLVDGKRDTVYISEDIPTRTPETEGGTNGRKDPLIQAIFAWNGPGRPDRLQWIEIRLPRDAGGDIDGEGRGRLFRDGLSLDGYALTYSGTDYVDSFEPTWPREIGRLDVVTSGYIRLPAVTLNEDSPTIILTSNATLFRQYYSVEGGVQVFDWRFLGGFADDGLPSLNFLLNPAGDVVHLRYVTSGDEQYIRDMVAYGDDALFGYYNGANDEDYAVPPFSTPAQWDEGETVPIPADNSSIRRTPACLDEDNLPSEWDEDPDPLPGNPHTSNDGTFKSVQLPEWVAHLTEDITDSVPANGGSLTVDNGAPLDLVGVIQLGTEQMYYVRKGNTLIHLQRAYNGTTPASHDTDALIYQVGEWVRAANLAQTVSPTSPATGEALLLDDTSLLPSSGTIRIDTEFMTFSGKTPNSVTGITRNAAGEPITVDQRGGPVHAFDDALGAHRWPLVSTIEWERAPRIGRTPLGFVFQIGPCDVEIWGSQEAEPLYPGDGAWEETWLTTRALKQWSVPFFQTPRKQRLSFTARRLAHVMHRTRQMSDYGIEGYSGRDKLNTFRVLRHQIARDDNPLSNDEPGAGAAIRDLLEELVPAGDIYIDPTAFLGTSVNIPVSEGNLESVIDELLERYIAVRRTTFDNKIEIMRHPMHPLGPRPGLKATFTPEMIRGRITRPQATINSRFGVGQVIVTCENEVTGEAYEGRYPPRLTQGEVKRLPPRAGNFTGIDDANHYAATMYLSDPEISDVFTFSTVGPCEWLQAGDRILLETYHDDAKPLGEKVNSIVLSAKYNKDGYTDVVTQEWRML